MDTSVDIESSVRLANNEISLGFAVPLARRYAKGGCWQVECLDARPMSALLAYACKPRGLDADSCADAIRKAAGLIGRDDNEVRARLRALPLRVAISKEDMQLAYRFARAYVPGQQLAAAVRRAKLCLGETPPFCKRLTLCDRGVVLGHGTVIAPLVELPNGQFGLKVEGRTAEILALLSVANGAPAPAHALDRLNSVSRALQRSDKVLAEIGLALVGQPALADRAAAETLAKAAEALHAGMDPCVLMKMFVIAPQAEKASPNDPKHPGWPKGAPNGRGGKFRPKTPDDAPPGIGHNNGPPLEPQIQGRLEYDGDGRMSSILSQIIKAGIRRLVALGIVAADFLSPEVMIPASILAELGTAAYPFVKAYFDAAQSLKALQEAAKSPARGYDIHHIVERATANPDGSERALINGSDNLVRIPTLKHWQLNSWYETENQDFSDMTPRQYLKGKSWDERRRVGLNGLRAVGVLQ